MITPLTKQDAAVFRERLSDPMERINVFPESNDYVSWVGKLAHFIGSKGGSLAFGVEEYKADFEFFTADNEEERALLLLATFAPHELVFFGLDWMIGISSYPESDGSGTLEYGIRLYGTARAIDHERIAGGVDCA